ncbi:MAG: recombination protein RecR [Candidatus Magasanikbacteria bacterium RIFCSPLOWO2_02_FULL_44_11]|uniref:Recombination protein RecR n=2 Tax=Candidatus Magasanikiibacteriota TaxID=1752731 RepID=A0A1F6NA87_9BACT|nr:MAG: recombination protein RecR [Candidatus Magasanikbacteria bacterium RIFCSPHIGHO2_02_FULL_45_10]OGH80834.1 MAG: recombination protein RecR [Candidatus Magasanikbacteria bacterium RIFCSPLOWO2_02_FULL_44_11]
MYPPAINNLIRALKRLPSVGERTAERFVFFLLKSGKKEVSELMLALKELIENIKSCEVCWNFSDTSPCAICANPKRDQTTVCVVTDAPDVNVIEKTGFYNGVYHILRNVYDPSDEQSLERIKLSELLARLKKRTIKEVILALNPDIAGETTMLLLEKEIKTASPEVRLTRLARGLPLGADLRYADEITLASAFKNRTQKQ